MMFHCCLQPKMERGTDEKNEEWKTTRFFYLIFPRLDFLFLLNLLTEITFILFLLLITSWGVIN